MRNEVLPRSASFLRLGVAIALSTSVAAAQPVPCEPCARGEAVLESLGEGGVQLRANTDELAGMEIDGDRMWPAQESRMSSWRAAATPELTAALEQLRAVPNEQLTDVAAALCTAPSGLCVERVGAALRCATGRCTIAEELPVRDGPGTCDPYVKSVNSSTHGIGGDYATGWQKSQYPTDGRAWSLGLEARQRLATTISAVVRVDRSTGRDAAQDADGDGRDDLSSGAVTRWSLLTGPSLMLTRSQGRELQRYIEVDTLVGFLATRSQLAEDGPLVGLDFAYQLAALRAGLRVVQGFGDAQDASSVLAHVGILVGNGLSYSYGAGCGHVEPAGTSPIALALDVPVSGWAKDLGYVAPGVGVEVAWHLAHRFDALARGDLLVFPSGNRDRVIHQSLLAGGRVDLSRGGRGMRSGVFLTGMAGYALAAAPSSSTYGSTPVADVSIGWMVQASDGALFARVHSRVGVIEPDVVAFFASIGFEVRLDRQRWSDRN